MRSRLIINADDVGVTAAVTVSSLAALKAGWVTACSVMMPCRYGPSTAQHLLAFSGLDAGVHLTLTSERQDPRWKPLLGPRAVPSLVGPEGYLHRTNEEVWTHADPIEVRHELQAQIYLAYRCNLRPTHLDGHMDALFGNAALWEVYLRLGREFGLPVLHERLPGESSHGRQGYPSSPIDRVLYLMEDADPGSWLAGYLNLLDGLPLGTYILLVHLGHDNDAEMGGPEIQDEPWGPAWRQRDLDVVQSPRFQAFLRERFDLIGWRQLP